MTMGTSPARDAPVSGPSGRPAQDGEQRFIVHGVSWKDYTILRDVLDVPGVRMTYLDGMLELMSPSPAHEHAKTLIARLIEIFAIERDVPLQGYGSTTFRREATNRGAEPDECYVRGGPLRDVPDIAIEVVMTSGGIDKLAVYEKLGVPEVWFFDSDEFTLHRLGPSGYVSVPQSTVVPELDLELLATFARRSDQHEAVRAFRDRLRAGG